MKFSIVSVVAGAALLQGCDAFVAPSNRRTTTTSFVSLKMADTTEAPPSLQSSDFGTAVSSSSNYEKLGVPEDKVAIGIEVEEVLQWLGTKEDIINKFMRDNKAFDRERAELETDKLLMDAELVNAFIKWSKMKTNQNLKQEAVNELSDWKTWATYAAWITGGVSFGWVRKNIIEPKYASGEWEEIHIKLPFMSGGDDAAADAVAGAAADVVSSSAPVADAVQSVAESM